MIVVINMPGVSDCATEVQPAWCSKMRPSDCYTVSDICCDECAKHIFDPRSDSTSSTLQCVHKKSNKLAFSDLLKIATA